MNYLLVFLGAGIGGTLRHTVNLIALRLPVAEYPLGTAAINVMGSFLMGVVAGTFMLKSDLSHGLRIFLATGVLGGFTTFSAFSLDAVALYERGEAGMAALYVVGSVVLSIAGLWAGLSLVRAALSA